MARCRCPRTSFSTKTIRRRCPPGTARIYSAACGVTIDCFVIVGAEIAVGLHVKPRIYARAGSHSSGFRFGDYSTLWGQCSDYTLSAYLGGATFRICIGERA
jgi:hypothetical protein